MTAAAPGPWPFVGRGDDLERIAAYAADPEISAVVLTGPAGAGKTRLVREATARAALPPMWWVASEAASGVPFGALVGVVDLDEDDTAASTFRRLAATVVDAGGVVVVDDAPHLDARSADLLHRLVDAGKATVLATAREGVLVPDWLSWLWLGERTRHVALGPLDGDEVAALVNRVLEDRAEAERAAAARVLGVRTGGNALFLRELLVDLRARADAGLALDLEAGAPSHLLRVLEARLRTAGPAVGEVLASVAVLGSVPLGVVTGRCGAAAVAEAERSGHVVVGEDPRATVRPAHPLHAEATLAALTTVARRETATAVAGAVLDDVGSTAPERLAAVAALVDMGADVPGDRLLDAARTAFAALDHDLAARLAERSACEGDPFEALVILGAAHSGAGHEAPAAAALREAFAVAVDDEQRARAAGRLSVHLVAHGQRIDDAAELLEEVLATLVDPTARSFVEADRAKLASMRGEVDPASMAGVGDGEDVVTLNAAIVGAYAQAMSGDAAACRATIERALPLAEVHRSVLPWSGELVRFSGVFAALVEAGPEAAAAEARAGSEAVAGAPDATGGTWRFLWGFADAVSGRLGAAVASLEVAAGELEGHDLVGARPLAVASAAWALAQLGEVERARSLLDAAVNAATLDGRVRAQVALADAWCDAVEGVGPGLATRLADAALAAADGGQVVAALLVAHDLVRLGAPGVAGDVLAGIERSAPPSWLLSWVRDRARAELEGDDASLVRLQRRADGRWPLAVAELHAVRHRLARTRGDEVTAARSALSALRVAGPSGGTRSPNQVPWTLRELQVPLTPREQEVADAVVAGSTSRAVAQAAEVSVRTVDNQLQSIYRKLGVASRKELAALLAGPPR